MWKKFILGIGTSLVVFIVLFQIGYVATSGPTFCAKCHEVKDYTTSWETSAHSKVTCLECHQPRGELGKFHASKNHSLA